MDSDNLNWERDKWGSKPNKGYFSKAFGKRQPNNTQINSVNLDNNNEIKNWRLPSGVQNQISKTREFRDDEKVWSRGGDVIFITAERLVNEMSKDDYTGHISIELLEPKLKIVDFLNNEKKLNVNLSQTFMKIILKDSEENLFEKDFRRFLILVLGTNFATKRIDSLINVDLISDPTVDLLNLVIRFLKLSFETLPGLAYDIFYPRVENLYVLVTGNRLNIDVSSTIISELEELRMLAVASCPKQCLAKGSTLSDSLQPPEDFRDMSIFPTERDLLENVSANVFLRENKYLGSYKSVDHYLDVQFRLMREDFVRPLREGVRVFKNNLNKSFDIRVYKNVRLIDAVPDRKMGIIHNVQLDQSRLTRVNWSESKRFMNGSLLCFSCDNFDSFTLGIVAKRNNNNLIQGILSVKFIDTGLLDYKEYTLLESTNLFESYQHVLQRLQNMDEDNFSMKDYLVYGKSDISLPKYLSNNMDLKYEFHGKEIRPGMPDEDWAKSVDIEMNESQYQGFRLALTKEIAIIQGPPGTGKTYVGLEICRCLLENVQSGLPDFGPILVVCYTNHALDQFLTGISQFTQNIIRIGGGCKSDVISRFSILDWKRRDDQNIIRCDSVLEELRLLEAEFEFRRIAFQSLIKLDRLRNFISSDYYDYFVRLRIEKWLKGESIDDEIGNNAECVNELVEKIIYEEIRKNVRKIVIEAFENPAESTERRLDIGLSDSDEENYIYVPGFRGRWRVNNRTTRNLFKMYLKKQTKMSAKEAAKVTSLDNLSITNRWRLYRYWRSLYVAYLKYSTREKEAEYDELCRKLNDILLENDEKIMLKKDIIGMTTTGAAKYGKVLERIGCKIIIVEEAAEVIESHIISSLNSNCQHLILIGDHKQLRPNPAVYELAKKYGLDLSLFERLINNGLGFSTLSTQHRMRPEISEIMRFIYSDLQDDPSVLQYPDVPAIRTNLFFFNHFEQEQTNDDILSYSNLFEAQFVIRFCRHLLGNGVVGERITILTLYSGQHFLINSLIDMTEFDGVRVCVVDNYQGEENDIIILSLVRSNEYEKIGFLSIENRICVSLSRAKHGLYVFGNFDILCSKNQMWKKICDLLKSKHLLDKSLNLFCQNHPDKELTIRTPDDFAKYPDYGCEELCLAVLKCGHICPKFCHFMDKNHDSYLCIEDCTNRCLNNHLCKKMCHERCGECMIGIEKTIPGCNHKQTIPCYKTPEPSDCRNPCQRVLSCSHQCSKLCYMACDPCLTKVTKISKRCGHSGEYLCHIRSTICNQICDYVLKCGHVCMGLCERTCWHSICDEHCKNLLICGHLFRAKYSIYKYPCVKDVEDQCSHTVLSSQCHSHRGECFVCRAQCPWNCKHQTCSRSCQEMCDRDICNEYCEKTLCCKACCKAFKCYGICGELCREVCRECDPGIKKDVRYITLRTCEHNFKVEYLDEYMFDTAASHREVVRKICPLCGVTITKRSCFRYMNVVRENTRTIENIQKLIAKKIDSFEYSSYYRMFHRLKDFILPLFKHYNVSNYFNKVGANDADIVDSLYDSYFDNDIRQTHIFVYKYRNAVLLLYAVYIGIHVCGGPQCSDDRYIATAQLIEWLHPHNRKFDDFDLGIFINEFYNIKNLIKHEMDKKPLETLMKEDSSDVSGFKSNVKLGIPSESLHFYLDNVFIEGYTTMRGFNCSDRRWFKCENGHLYNNGECLRCPPRCPQCYPDRLWLKKQIIRLRSEC